MVRKVIVTPVFHMKEFCQNSKLYFLEKEGRREGGEEWERIRMNELRLISDLQMHFPNVVNVGM